jgi:hypothetical protein
MNKSRACLWPPPHPSLSPLPSLPAVYWRYLSYRTYYQGYGGNSDRAFHGEKHWGVSAQ